MNWLVRTVCLISCEKIHFPICTGSQTKKEIHGKVMKLSATLHRWVTPRLTVFLFCKTEDGQDPCPLYNKEVLVAMH